MALPPPGELSRAVMMGAGWIINVMVAEWIIRRGSSRDTRPVRSVHAKARRELKDANGSRRFRNAAVN